MLVLNFATGKIETFILVSLKLGRIYVCVEPKCTRDIYALLGSRESAGGQRPSGNSKSV